MRRIELSRKFKRDYLREHSGIHGKSLDALLNKILDRIEADEVLPPNASDHALVGNFAGYRDCHIKPDLILISTAKQATTFLSWYGWDHTANSGYR